MDAGTRSANVDMRQKHLPCFTAIPNASEHGTMQSQSGLSVDCQIACAATGSHGVTRINWEELRSSVDPCFVRA